MLMFRDVLFRFVSFRDVLFRSVPSPAVPSHSTPFHFAPFHSVSFPCRFRAVSVPFLCRQSTSFIVANSASTSSDFVAVVAYARKRSHALYFVDAY